MEGTEMVVAIVAMSLGYGIIVTAIRHIFPTNEKGERMRKRNKRKHHHPPPFQGMSLEEQDALQMRAAELQRRVNTLEEIITSERELARSEL